MPEGQDGILKLAWKHVFDRSDTQATNFGEVWLHYIRDAWSPHCKLLPIASTLDYYRSIPFWACIFGFIAVHIYA
jgi:hypothetical protein